MALQPDGKVIIGGGFTDIGGTWRHYIARLNSTPGVLAFSSSKFSVGEGDGAANFTLKRTGGADTAVVANPGADFNLAVGKSATISGTDYRIKFNRVTEDSRCPVDVQCVWAGDAKIELTVARNSAPDDTRVISLTPPNSEATVGNVKIRFVSLAPTPRQSEPPASRPYVARLMVLTP